MIAEMEMEEMQEIMVLEMMMEEMMMGGMGEMVEQWQWQ